MSNSRQVFNIARTAVRHLSKSSKTNNNAVVEAVNPKFKELKEIQKKFGIEDNTPVYLKGGVGDKLLYGFTLVLMGVGIGMTVETWYSLTFKK